VPDWAIPITAFAGALVGAVLQPVTNYAMDRLRARERIRKSRERTLRRMIESQIAAARRHCMALTVVWGFRQLGHSAPPIRDLLKSEDSPGRGLICTPDRISDPELRAAAAEYAQLVANLGVAIWFQELDADSEEKLLPLTHRLGELERAIIRRMDELDWPQVDD
jgi:hypothetical protein